MDLHRIISGGQTGVDRAALDVALALGIDHGGWCPRGRRAEDGVIPEKYNVWETSSASYRHRTRRNVVESDATLILFVDQMTGGTKYTYEVVLDQGKLHFLVDLAAPPHSQEVADWLLQNPIGVLNIAGPRSSTAPGVGELARRFLEEVFHQAG